MKQPNMNQILIEQEIECDINTEENKQANTYFDNR